MLKRSLASLAVLLLFGLTFPIDSFTQSTGVENIPLIPVTSHELLRTLADGGRANVIVALKKPLSGGLDAKRREISETQTYVLSSISSTDFELKYRYEAISALAGNLNLNGLLKLANHPSVIRIDLDAEGSGQLNKSVPQIRADAVHELGITGQDIVVAVLDSGVDPDHPDLRDGLIAEQCFCSVKGGCCPDGTAEQSGPGGAIDRAGHGTNVTGIIASRGNVASVGVAPGSRIIAVKVLDDTPPSGRGLLSDWIRGLDWIIANRPDVQVINMSLVAGLFFGYCDNFDATTRALSEAVNTLRANGTITFACSGNNKSLIGMSFPGCIRNVVSVAAVYVNDMGPFACDDTTMADQITCFSNRNDTLDLLAPGCPIRSSGLQGGTSTYCGTSQASPHAAGVAALLLSANAELTPDQIEAVLKNTGRRIFDSATGLEFPRIDALDAINAVGAGGSEALSASPD